MGREGGREEVLASASVGSVALPVVASVLTPAIPGVLLEMSARKIKTIWVKCCCLSALLPWRGRDRIKGSGAGGDPLRPQEPV
jgi:hypothetical protein